MSVEWLKATRASAGSNLESEFYLRTQEAELARPREVAACTRLQAAWRGRTARVRIAFWSYHVLIVERTSRGHLGRQRARRLRLARDTMLQHAFFDAYATTIQLRFRGFHSRKYLHNFYARKAYVDAVVHKGEAVRVQLQQKLEQQVTLRSIATLDLPLPHHKPLAPSHPHPFCCPADG